MVFSSPLNFGSSLHPVLLLLLIIAVATQVLQDLFGLKISSLVLADPEVSEGSADEPLPLTHTRHGDVAPSRVFLDLLGRHRKLQGRSRKGVGRGCFGMKVDRIGVISGLGC
ncbi:C-type natriuretic peptide 2 [Labeo rohita]|uniref:C-type natriuretic peptide 2 n=1 Tax=Labeo rohita TaxID=84645 RepID=A0ABQ8KZI8_LABRO|nr:C-type natriuretic peptide 2 [Labeo rohita]